MIVDSALYRGGVRVPVDCDTDDLDTLRGKATHDGDFVWVGLYQPEMAELDRVAGVFGLHQLAVEDAVSAHQRPKLERYADNLFLTLKTLSYVDAEDAVETGEISIFVGSDFVVTVRHGEHGALHDARISLESREHVLAHGPSSVVYAVCDAVVDRYEEVAAALETDVDEVEESVFSPARTNDSVRIYTLKREIAEVRRAVLPLREPMGRFASGSVPGIDPDGGAVLPRRLRPPEPGRRCHRHPRLPAVHGLRRAHRADLGAAERGHAQDLGGRRPGRRADLHRRRLRHELRAHARARLDPAATRSPCW